MGFRQHIIRIQNSSQRMLPYWLAAAAVSAMSVGFAKLFSLSESLAFKWISDYPALSFIIVPLGLLSSSALVEFVSSGAGGSGIPQLLAAVEITHHHDEKYSRLKEQLLGIRMIIVKIFGTCLCVAGGGITGREGPNLQIAAGLFYQVQKLWVKTKVKFAPNMQSMVLAGGAAGLASAFNTPLGGVVFAIEELAKVHISTIRTYTFHAVIIAGLLTQAILGNYLYFGKFEMQAPGMFEILPLIIGSMLIGLIGGLFGKVIVVTLDWRSSRTRTVRLLMSGACGLLLATLIYFLGRESAGSGREVITTLLLQKKVPADLSLPLARVLGNLFTYCAGVIGGVFAPALSAGASLGSWMGGFIPNSDLQIWVLMGMVAFLTGLTRTPFTSLILVLEMTDTHNVILVLMLSAIVAQSAAHIIDPISFYEHMAHRIIHGKVKEEQQ